MEKHPTNNPSFSPPNNNDNNASKEEESLRRIGAKRDEWSEGAVSSLIDAYEAKWVLRNRAKLKGQDWEDVARHVSSRANAKCPKTMTQCKNKIESMKKRYRSESNSPDSSSWPLFPRLHLLLRCKAPPPPPPPPPPLMLLDPPPVPPPPAAGTPQDSPGINGVVAVAEENGVEANNTPIETDISTPTCNGYKESPKKRKRKRKKEGRRDEWELADTVRWLAEVVVRSEQARIETMRELERIRAEAEAKKGEMDLKRTEIIANTQLEIARLLVGKGEDIDSPLGVGRN